MARIIYLICLEIFITGSHVVYLEYIAVIVIYYEGKNTISTPNEKTINQRDPDVMGSGSTTGETAHSTGEFTSCTGNLMESGNCIFLSVLFLIKATTSILNDRANQSSRPRGREHGIWEKYHKDGTLMWRGNYFHGELHGLWEWYWEDGIIWLKEKYHHGINYGLKIIYSFEEPEDSIKKYI